MKPLELDCYKGLLRKRRWCAGVLVFQVLALLFHTHVVTSVSFLSWNRAWLSFITWPGLALLAAFQFRHWSRVCARVRYYKHVLGLLDAARGATGILRIHYHEQAMAALTKANGDEEWLVTKPVSKPHEQNQE